MSIESTPVSKQEIIDGVCQEKGIEIKDGCVDLSSMTFEEARSFLENLAATNQFVFHGTCSDEVYRCLETRQANCSVKESGNKNAVYAAEAPVVSLVVSVLNKKYLRQTLDISSTGYSITGESIKIRFSPEVYKMFESNDPNLFSDGYIYVLDRENFVNAPDAGSEWHSETSAEPMLACRVSKNIATTIYRNDNVVEVSDEELSRKKY